MGRVLVTGGAGYVGIHTVDALLSAGHQVVVVDSLENSTGADLQRVFSCPLIEADLNDEESVVAALSEHEIDAVLHLAAYAYVGESTEQPIRYWKNNVGGTVSLLSAMQRCKVTKIVFSSTCAIYGTPDTVPIDEAQPKRPINPYGMTKLVSEHLLDDAAAEGVRSVCLRYFNVAGADPQARFGERHDPEPHLIPLILDVAIGVRDSITIFGTDYPTPDGTCIRDYIHVCDLARAHVMALGHLESGGESLRLNLGNSTGFSNREIVEAVRRVTGAEVPIVEGERRPGDPAELVGANEAAARQLDWRPSYVEIDEIISHAWAWHQVRDHYADRA